MNEINTYGPQQATKKEKNRMYQTKFRERNREELREKKRLYDAKIKEVVTAYKELIIATKEINSVEEQHKKEN